MIRKLAEKVTELTNKGLTLQQVMHVALSRGVQPLQARAHPMWQFTGKNDPTRVIRGGFFEGRSMQEMLSLMFKGKATEFPNDSSDAGFSAHVQMIEVSTCSHRLSFPQ